MYTYMSREREREREREIPDFRVDCDMAEQAKPANPYGNPCGREQWINLHVQIRHTSDLQPNLANKIRADLAQNEREIHGYGRI